jgi:putative SOS response-associated peptidase YedK
MCGRYAATANPGELVEEFEIDVDRTAEPARSVLTSPQEPPAGTPDYNMAPTKQAPVVLTRVPREASEGPPQRQLRRLTWGLVPGWSRDTKGGARMINARAESVLAKPAYARAVERRRCLVPALGWYEWQVSPSAIDGRGKARRQPFFTRRADGASVGFAGLYEFWRDPVVENVDDPDAWLVTFAIITTAAEPGLDRIHDRQPLVLERGDWGRWLDPSVTEGAAIEDLLAFSRPGRFEAYPVSTAVGSGRANGPGLIEPASVETLDGVVDPVTGEIIGAR